MNVVKVSFGQGFPMPQKFVFILSEVSIDGTASLLRVMTATLAEVLESLRKRLKALKSTTTKGARRLLGRAWRTSNRTAKASKGGVSQIKPGRPEGLKSNTDK